MARSIDQSLEVFLEMLLVERGASNNTIDAYRRDLEDLTAFQSSNGRSLVSANSDDLRAYLKSLNQRAMAPGTVARKLSTLRQYFRFLW